MVHSWQWADRWLWGVHILGWREAVFGLMHINFCCLLAVLINLVLSNCYANSHTEWQIRFSSVLPEKFSNFIDTVCNLDYVLECWEVKKKKQRRDRYCVCRRILQRRLTLLDTARATFIEVFWQREIVRLHRSEYWNSDDRRWVELQQPRWVSPFKVGECNDYYWENLIRLWRSEKHYK